MNHPRRSAWTLGVWVSLLLLFLAVSSLAAQPDAGAAVRFQGEALFVLRTRVGSFTPEERSKAVSERLDELSHHPFEPPEPLRIDNSGPTADLYSGSTLILSVTDEDATLERTGRLTLAHTWSALIHRALERHSLAARIQSLLRSALLTAGLLAGLGLAFWATGRLARWTGSRLEALPDAGFPSLRWQRLTLLSPAQARRAITGLVTGLRWAFNLALAYLCMSLAFSLFPWTRNLAGRLLEAIAIPLRLSMRAFLDYLPNLLVLALVLLACRYLLKLLRLVSRGVHSGRLRFQGFHSEWAEPTYKLARVLVWASALIVAFPYLPGSDSEVFKGVTIFAGIVFSLGSTGLMGNAIAGVLLTYMRAFRVGDRIQVGDTLGDVVESSLLVTRVRTIKNVDVTIPNAMLLGSQVQNFSANAPDRGLILHTTVTIGYDAPWRTVHRLLIEAAKATEGILPEPEPFVLQTSLDDFYVSYQINAYTRNPQAMANLYSALHMNIQEAFNTAGVEIMSPHYRAERDGNAIAIPEAHRPEGYRAPAFRVENTSGEKS